MNLPLPPHPVAVLAGFIYALRLTIIPGSRPETRHCDARAVWDALWVRFALALIIALIAVKTDVMAILPLLACIVLVETLAFPVAAHVILDKTGMQGHFGLLIMALTWVDNFTIAIMMILRMIGNATGDSILIFLVPLVFWLVWVKYSVARRCLAGRTGLAAGMLLLYFAVNIGYAIAVHALVSPLFEPPPA